MNKSQSPKLLLDEIIREENAEIEAETEDGAPGMPTSTSRAEEPKQAVRSEETRKE